MEIYDINSLKYLDVSFDDKHVGTLAVYQGRLIAFEYSDNWIQNGFAISPFSLPLQKKLYIPRIDPFDGLYGVFADSLPDGWGRLLVDRMLLGKQINPHEVNMLNRLAIVGDSGMGALTYKPCYKWNSEETIYQYDHIANECKKVLESEYSDDLDKLFLLGGSSGGARPKILTLINEEDWIVKFPSSTDGKNSGEIEYRYSLCAKKCGIEMAETALLPSKQCSGYFGTKRFDRIKSNTGNTQRIHMLSVSALLEASHRIPALDYNSLMALTLELTKDYSEVEKMYRLMCFNVFSHNRDDHSSNFTFLYDINISKWKMAPAYDLTHSSSIGGEHATCINGNGRNPSKTDILAVAEKIGIAKYKAKQIADLVEQTVHDELGDIIE
ncbi:MAG: type II toxin-antitoxin system HipA family toxin [Oscillospiraceae bacterium]|nr:type II toxin-antitoxin system HipA family toxin [Oscillospiraceae bacterium]